MKYGENHAVDCSVPCLRTLTVTPLSDLVRHVAAFLLSPRRTLLFWCLLPIATFADPVQNLPPAAVQQIDAAVEAWRSDSQAPALSVAVVTDNKIVFSKGYGLADLEKKVPARSDTVYRLASLTKSLTAVAVMQLVEAGKLDLDAPIQKYWPSYPQKQWTITPRQ